MPIGYYTWAANLRAYFNTPMHARVDKHVKVQTYTYWYKGTGRDFAAKWLINTVFFYECV